MSLNIGNKDSMYVVVSNVAKKYAVSENILFANLRTSRKTGNNKVDKETGEVLDVPERAYSHWEARFVGNAIEPAKALKNGTAINIVTGWIDNESRQSAKTGRYYTNLIVTISDFVLSDQNYEQTDEQSDEEDNPFINLNYDVDTPGDRGRG